MTGAGETELMGVLGRWEDELARSSAEATLIMIAPLYGGARLATGYSRESKERVQEFESRSLEKLG